MQTHTSHWICVWITPWVFKRQHNTHEFWQECFFSVVFIIGIPWSFVKSYHNTMTTDHLIRFTLKQHIALKCHKSFQYRRNVLNYLELIFLTHRTCMATTLCRIHVETSWISFGMIFYLRYKQIFFIFLFFYLRCRSINLRLLREIIIFFSSYFLFVLSLPFFLFLTLLNHNVCVCFFYCISFITLTFYNFDRNSH